MKRALYAASLVVMTTVLVCGPAAAQVGGTDLEQNPPGDGSGDPVDPSGGSCPDPWPITATVLAVPQTGVRDLGEPSTGRRSITRDFNGRFQAELCPLDEIAFDTTVSGNPRLRIFNRDATRTMTIRWTFVGGSTIDESIPPGGQLDREFDGWNRVEITSDPYEPQENPKGPTI